MRIRVIHLVLASALLAASVTTAQPLTKPTAGERPFQEGQVPAGSTIERAILELADGSTEIIDYAATPDGKAVLDGDILITVGKDGRARIAQAFERLWSERLWSERQSSENQSNEQGVSTKSTGINGASFRWQNNTVPFVINVGSNFQRNQILDAMQHVEDRSAVRFIPRTNQTDFVDFVNLGGVCRSFVGRQGGRQVIELDPLGCQFGQIVHEVGHALGLWHEHQRTDRDNSVVVNWGNIQAGAGSNFQKRSGFLRGPFDFNSIMNYGSFFFAINPAIPTLTRLDSSTWVANRAALTATDSTGIGDMYRRVEASIIYDCFSFLMTCDFSGSSRNGVQPVTSWSWTIDDGNVGVIRTGGFVTYQFQNPGQHHVFLEVIDSQGDRGSAVVVVNIDPNCPFRDCD